MLLKRTEFEHRRDLSFKTSRAVEDERRLMITSNSVEAPVGIVKDTQPSSTLKNSHRLTESIYVYLRRMPCGAMECAMKRALVCL